jgi:hypothetical protein
VSTARIRGIGGMNAGSFTPISGQRAQRGKAQIERGERFSRDNRRNFSVEGREEKERGEQVNRVEGHSVIKEFAPISSDQMRQMIEQLTVLLSQNEEKGKAFGIILNSSIYSKNDKWILDLGAIDHMTGNKNLLFNLRKYNTKQYVTVANNERMKIIGDGSIKILSKIIPNVLLVKNCASNLLSIRKLTLELN